MRVFVDTNVLVAAFGTRGLCSDVMRVVLAEHELLTSRTVLRELSRALVRKMRMPEESAKEVVAFVRTHGTVVDPLTSAPPVTVRDADDAVILGEALAAGADLLVTGDRDLLELEHVSLRIVDPRGFWALTRRGL